jgi:hypothetical protein
VIFWFSCYREDRSKEKWHRRTAEQVAAITRAMRPPPVHLDCDSSLRLPTRLASKPCFVTYRSPRAFMNIGVARRQDGDRLRD